MLKELMPWITRTDGLLTVTDITNKLYISCGSAYSIIHIDHGYPKICARRVTKQLIDEHK
jgi:hypothetical protein